MPKPSRAVLVGYDHSKFRVVPHAAVNMLNLVKFRNVGQMRWAGLLKSGIIRQQRNGWTGQI